MNFWRVVKIIWVSYEFYSFGNWTSESSLLAWDLKLDQLSCLELVRGAVQKKYSLFAKKIKYFGWKNKKCLECSEIQPDFFFIIHQAFLVSQTFICIHEDKFTFLLICPLRPGGLKALSNMFAKNKLFSCEIFGHFCMGVR